MKTRPISVRRWAAFVSPMVLSAGGATWQWKYMLEALGLGEFPSNLEVLNCIQGGNIYRTVKPSNSVSSNVSPNSAGNPSICATPSSELATWYIKTTTDGGATWQWKYTLGLWDLGNNPVR
jgi:hypothetical protein